MPKRPPAVSNNKPSPLDGKLFLVGLGAQKAGSTWLARYFGDHPRIYVPRLKELHYFDVVYKPELRGYANDRMIRLAKEIADDLYLEGTVRPNLKKMEKLLAVIDRLQMTADKRYPYLKFFEDRVTDEDVFCDITPAYALLDERGFRAIEATHPDVKYIFLMRDPIDRFWSALRMGLRKIENFDPVGRFEGLLEDPEHFGRSDYPATIRALEAVVPAERIKYVFYEDLFRSETVDELTAFVGVEPILARFDSVVNPGAKVDLAPEHIAAAREKFRHVYDFIFDRFGDRVPAMWRRMIGEGVA